MLLDIRTGHSPVVLNVTASWPLQLWWGSHFRSTSQITCECGLTKFSSRMRWVAKKPTWYHINYVIPPCILQAGPTSKWYWDRMTSRTGQPNKSPKEGFWFQWTVFGWPLKFMFCYIYNHITMNTNTPDQICLQICWDMIIHWHLNQWGDDWWLQAWRHSQDALWWWLIVTIVCQMLSRRTKNSLYSTNI